MLSAKNDPSKKCTLENIHGEKLNWELAYPDDDLEQEIEVEQVITIRQNGDGDDD